MCSAMRIHATAAHLHQTGHQTTPPRRMMAPAVRPIFGAAHSGRPTPSACTPHSRGRIASARHNLEAYRAEAMRAGADALINQSELSDAWVSSPVEKIMAKAQRTSILIVDDSPTIRRMVMAALRPLDAEFGEAATGLEAIEQLALGDYDAMTLDLNMPDMHGMEVLQFLRRSERYRALPVVILTTRGDEDSRFQALADGANLYLTKPFHPEALVNAVRGLLTP